MSDISPHSFPYEKKPWLYQLLFELDLNARDSYAALSRRLGWSKETTAYRIQSLETLGIIRGYMTVVDISLLGYTAYGVWARLETKKAGERNNIFAALQKEEAVYWIGSFGGNFDCVAAIQAKDAQEFTKIFARLQSKHSKIAHTVVATRVNATQFRRQYLSSKKRDSRTLRFHANSKPSQIDETDRRIVAALVRSPRKSSVELARELRLSRSTFLSRLERLESSGVIQGYATLIDVGRLGFETYMLLLRLRRTDEKTKLALYRYAAAHPGITFFVEVFGSWHIEITCEVRGLFELHNIVVELRSEFPAAIEEMTMLGAFDYFLKYRVRT